MSLLVFLRNRTSCEDAALKRLDEKTLAPWLYVMWYM